MKDCPSTFVSPPPKRRRVTARLGADVVDAYESGQTSRGREVGAGPDDSLEDPEGCRSGGTAAGPLIVAHSPNGLASKKSARSVTSRLMSYRRRKLM